MASELKSVIKKSPSKASHVDSVSARVFVGVDVAKDELVIAQGDQVQTIKNNQTAISAWLKKLPSGVCIGCEATGAYHLLLADLAYAQSLRVFVLNPHQVQEYRKSLGGRAKTDRCDALVLARFVQREHEELHPYVPLTPSQRKLVTLLRRRSKIVQARVNLQQSIGALPQDLLKAAGVGTQYKSMMKQFNMLVKQLDKAIELFLKQCELGEAAERLRTITGVGTVTSAALLAALQRGTFASADAFVAFLGLDLEVKDSGQHKGQRRLSKRGDSQTRALLYTAAMTAIRDAEWKKLYEGYLKRGFKKIQALVIIARRLARTAWSMYKHGTSFSSERLTRPLQRT